MAGYPPLRMAACDGAELASRADPKVVLWRCGAGGWRPVYLGARHLLGGCTLAEGEEPASLPAALPGLFACHARPEEVLDEAGEGRAALLVATAETALPLDERGGDAWLSAVESLPAADRAAAEAPLRTLRSAAGAWRGQRLGVMPTAETAAALVSALVDAPREPLRDLALPALLRATPALPDRASLACRGVPEPSGTDLARDLRAALALALGEEVGECASLRLPEDACLAALRCEEPLCSAEELRKRVSEALERPAGELARQPGLTAEDVVAARGETA